MASESLKSKNAIVTGASRGIGAAIATALAARGANVLLTYTSPNSERRVAAVIDNIQNNDASSQAWAISADLRDPASPGKIVAEALSKFNTKTIDILVNNAGTELVRPLQDITAEDFSYIYDLNVRGAVLMAKAVFPHLPPSRGRIINIASVGARCGFANLSLYCSSKAALEGLTRCWAAELGPRGHTVNCVNPGPVQTDVLDGIPKNIVEKQKEATPVENRLGTVEDVADIVAFLAEERSRWVSGQCISASGGLNMY